MPTVRPLALGILMALVLWLGAANCPAAATYSVTDLRLSDVGNPGFDAQGNVALKTVGPYVPVRNQSGSYSLSNGPVKWHDMDDGQSAFAQAAGQQWVRVRATDGAS